MLVFIDLKTFFPTCQREPIDVACMYAGLPEDVRKVTDALYTGAVAAYETRHGITPLKPWETTNQGSRLSPHRCRLFLNTLAEAVEVVGGGMTLWGSWQRLHAAATRLL